MWYMSKLSYLSLTSNLELAKDGQLYKKVKFSLEQLQSPTGSANVFTFFFNVDARGGLLAPRPGQLTPRNYPEPIA